MKPAAILFVAGLLLLAAVAVHAAEPQATPELAPAPQPQVVPTTLVGDSVLASLGSGCGDDATNTLAVGLPGTTKTGHLLTCGSCSSSGCKGAPRGQLCWLGGGWGNCNIYSGGYLCSDGSGWECQCGSGPLP